MEKETIIPEYISERLINSVCLSSGLDANQRLQLIDFAKLHDQVKNYGVGRRFSNEAEEAALTEALRAYVDSSDSKLGAACNAYLEKMNQSAIENEP